MVKGQVRERLENNYLTRAQWAEELKVCKRSIDRYVKDGNLKRVRVGRELYISKEDMENYLFGTKKGKPRNKKSK